MYDAAATQWPSLRRGSRGASARMRWLLPLGVLAVVVLLLVVPTVGSYNRLVDLDNRADTEFANLDAQLQRRNDLIPQLVGAVRGALGQEQAVFGEIARARATQVRRPSTRSRR